MTMAEIDALRLDETDVTRLRELDGKHYTSHRDPEFVEWRELVDRRKRVEAALREWWAQDCRARAALPVAPGGVLQLEPDDVLVVRYAGELLSDHTRARLVHEFAVTGRKVVVLDGGELMAVRTAGGRA